MGSQRVGHDRVIMHTHRLQEKTKTKTHVLSDFPKERVEGKGRFELFSLEISYALGSTAESLTFHNVKDKSPHNPRLSVTPD